MRYKIGARRTGVFKKILLSKKLALVYIMIAAILSIHSYNKLLTEKITAPVVFEATTSTTNLINSVVNEYLSNNNDFSAKCVTLSPNSESGAYSYSVNAELVSDAKERIIKNLTSELEKNDEIAIKIPVGSLTNNQYFSGKGFPVRAKVHSEHKIDCQTKSSFESVGINQSLYKLTMNINVELDLIFPKGHHTVPISCDVTLAEKIILGGVPLA